MLNLSIKRQRGKHKAVFFIESPKKRKYTPHRAAHAVPSWPCAYWTEFGFNLHTNMTTATLTKAHVAFIAPRFVISQIFVRTGNTNDPGSWEHGTWANCLQTDWASENWYYSFKNPLISSGLVTRIQNKEPYFNGHKKKKIPALKNAPQDRQSFSSTMEKV